MYKRNTSDPTKHNSISNNSTERSKKNNFKFNSDNRYRRGTRYDIKTSVPKPKPKFKSRFKSKSKSKKAKPSWIPAPSPENSWAGIAKGLNDEVHYLPKRLQETEDLKEIDEIDENKEWEDNFDGEYIAT